MSRVVIALLLAVAAARSAESQSSDLPPVFMGSVHAIPLPEGPGGWVLQIVSRGGLTGRGAGDLVLFSDGRMRVSGADARSIQPEPLNVLAHRIRNTVPSSWTIGSRLRSTCNDCIATLIALTLRDSDGALRTYTAFWDETTRARIPDEVLHIHDLAVNLPRP